MHYLQRYGLLHVTTYSHVHWVIGHSLTSMNLSFNARERNIARHTLGFTYQVLGMRGGWCLGQSNFWFSGRKQIGFSCLCSCRTWFIFRTERSAVSLCVGCMFSRYFDKFAHVCIRCRFWFQRDVIHSITCFGFDAVLRHSVSFSHFYFVSIKPPISLIRLSRGNSVSWSMNVGRTQHGLNFFLVVPDSCTQ